MSINLSFIVRKIGYNLSKSIASHNSLRCICKASTSVSANNSKIPLKSWCTPVPPIGKTSEISSIISMHVGLSHIGWARIEVNEDQLTHLDITKLPHECLKMDLNDLYLLVSKIVMSFPDASAYVMESVSKSFRGGSQQIAYQVTNFQVMAMILTLLNSKSSVPDSQVVFSLKPRLAGRLFDLLVGSEVVSSLTVVSELLQEQNDKYSSHIKTTSRVIMKYQKSNDAEKEIMGRSLLQGLAFLNLIVHQKEECFQKLLRNPEKF